MFFLLHVYIRFSHSPQGNTKQRAGFMRIDQRSGAAKNKIGHTEDAENTGFEQAAIHFHMVFPWFCLCHVGRIPERFPHPRFSLRAPPCFSIISTCSQLSQISTTKLTHFHRFTIMVN